MEGTICLERSIKMVKSIRSTLPGSRITGSGVYPVLVPAVEVGAKSVVPS